jgi:hypothetical protein
MDDEQYTCTYCRDGLTMIGGQRLIRCKCGHVFDRMELAMARAKRARNAHKIRLSAAAVAGAAILTWLVFVS